MRNTRGGRSIVGIVLTFSVIAVGVPAADGEGSGLDRLLTTIARQKIVETPLRADGSIEIDAPSGKVTDQITILSGGGATVPLLVALDKSKVRALLVREKRHVAAEDDITAATLATPFGETRFVLEDFLPFDPARCMGVHVVDDLPDHLTVRCDPKADSGTPYSLTVWKFDRERGVPLQVLAYKKTLSNLVKRLKADDYVAVGGKWRPRRIVVQDFELGAKDVLTLEWKEDRAIDVKLFDPVTFATVTLSPAK